MLSPLYFRDRDRYTILALCSADHLILIKDQPGNPDSNIAVKDQGDAALPWSG